MRLLGGVLAAAGALMLLAAGTAPAWAYGPGGGSATISVTVTESNGIASLTVTGSGFGPDETVQFIAYYPTSSIGATTSTASGTISVTLTLPAGFSAGTHTLVATGTVSGNSGSATFTLPSATAASNPCPNTTSATRGGAAAGTIVLASFYTAPCLSTTPGLVTPATPRSPGGPTLPFTGAQSGLLASIGAGALGLGGLLVLASRRRRMSSWK